MRFNRNFRKCRMFRNLSITTSIMSAIAGVTSIWLGNMMIDILNRGQTVWLGEFIEFLRLYG